ncbi:MAG TPA: hypothetical protein PKK00_02735 [Bacteroidales bacterium]|nr:hypothetical protein [Bacteroidales bacterium]HPS16389.1 hypothetical protein [Bacteroidales bacterium]
MKRIIIILMWVILIAGVGVLIAFIQKQQDAVICKNQSVLIKYDSDDYFITESDIWDYLSGKGYKLKDNSLAEINSNDIESALNEIPYVEKADVSTNIEGDIEIKIKQRRPLVKVINKFNQSYYIDDKGFLMPGSEKYSARLLVANGNIDNYYAPKIKLDVNDSLSADSNIMKTAAYKVFRIAQFIDKDEFWKAMIEEIYVNTKGEMELFTKIGDAVVIFGNIDNMEEKFNNLLVFYKKGLNKIGWSKYKKINLKYKNQVVCSKT